MTILDKVTLQQQDTTKIFLFKEGVFYKAYNEGAFLLKDRDYKVAVKHIKSIENEVLSIGFPISVLEKLKENSKEESPYDPEFVKKIVERSENVKRGNVVEYTPELKRQWFGK